MKFIHIADVHIGAEPDTGFPWSEARGREIIESFESIIDKCNEENIDLLLIAGDLFHKQPLMRELKEVNYYFSKLNRTQVIIIVGNHDFVGVRSNYKGFGWNENVFILLEEDLDSVYFEEINTEIYGFSYHTREITEPKFHKIRPGCEERINILLGHGGSSKNIPFDKKILESLGFDYIALGHIHKPQLITNRIAYSGSLEPIDKNEIGERGYILGELTKNETSDITLTFIPNSKRQYIRVTLEVDQNTTNGTIIDYMKKAMNDRGMEHMYIFTLKGSRDRDVHFNTESFLRYGNILEVVDDTKPDYDFNNLQRENEDNIIGLYIKKINEHNGDAVILDKALYYGMEALLGAKNYK
jgi:DNA repair protein SbcD/Mre11